MKQTQTILALFFAVLALPVAAAGQGEGGSTGVTSNNQAIDNIVKNAEESLSDDEGKIIISTEQDGSNVKIHIQDTGCGIAKTDMERIFDPFFTTKSALHRPGLGLLASLGIVKNHKGDIDVHSEPGKGTTFTVILPLNLKHVLNQNGGS